MSSSTEWPGITPVSVHLSVRVQVNPDPYATVLPAETLSTAPDYIRDYVARVLQNSYLSELGVLAVNGVQFAHEDSPVRWHIEPATPNGAAHDG